LEIARDLVCREFDAPQWWSEFFADHLVQDQHRESMGMTTYPGGGTSTANPAAATASTGTRTSRAASTARGTACTSRPAHVGAAAIRKIGINSLADLVTFDFQSHWTRLIKLYTIDCERLGRYHRNRRSGSRRSKAYVSRHGAFSYNHDRMLGGQLYRLRSRHPYRCPQCRTSNEPSAEACENCGTRKQGHPWDIQHSLQQFVDSYGRGPFLRPLFDRPPLFIMVMRHFSQLLPKTRTTARQSSLSSFRNPNLVNTDRPMTRVTTDQDRSGLSDRDQ
jgi:hypothetical protein